MVYVTIENVAEIQIVGLLAAVVRRFGYLEHIPLQAFIQQTKFSSIGNGYFNVCVN